MCRNDNLPFAIVPILVQGSATGYVTYKSGQLYKDVTFEIQCLSLSLTQKIVEKIFKEACQLGHMYTSGHDTVLVYSISVTLRERLMNPKPYMLKIARLIGKCVEHPIEDREDIQALQKAIELLGL